MLGKLVVGEIAVGEVVTGEIVLGKLRWGNDLTPSFILLISYSSIHLYVSTVLHLFIYTSN